MEVRGLRSANGQLRQELTSSRGERDQVQFRLNLLREDLGAVQQAREEGEQRVQELDDQLQEERGRLVSSHFGLLPRLEECVCSERRGRSWK